MDDDTKYTIVVGLMMFCFPIGLIAAIGFYIAHLKEEREYKEAVAKNASYD